MENRRNGFFEFTKYWFILNYKVMLTIFVITFGLVFYAKNHFYDEALFGLGYIYEIGYIYYLASNASTKIFSILNVSLPFSRKELWRFHFGFQTIFLGMFLVFKCLTCKSFFQLLIEMSVLFLIYGFEAKLLTHPEQSLVVVILYAICRLSISVLKITNAIMFKDTIKGAYKVLIFIICFLIFVIANRCYWKKWEKRFVQVRGVVGN